MILIAVLLAKWYPILGKMNDIQNGIYIGGGTGIADGILLNGKIINLNT